MPVLNADRLLKKLSDLPGALQKPIEAALKTSTDEMSEMATKQIEQGLTQGRAYRRNGQTHIASVPGAYPNEDTGDLVAGMFSQITAALTAVWGNSSDHARPLEYGTSRMAARPFMLPTFNQLKSAASARVTTAVNAAIKAFAGK
jgi:HK97 gp10 family phage protein